MALPKIPAEITDKGWTKAAGPQLATIEKAHGSFSGSLSMTLAAVPEKSLKAIESLESAVKSRDGGAIIKLYQKVGDDVCPEIERMQRLAGEYEKSCKSAGSTLKKSVDTKAAGEWLLKSGPALVEYADALLALAEDLLQEAEKVPTEKISDFNWDLNDWDLTHLLTKVLAIKLDSISLPDKKPVVVSISGKAGAEATKNATLRAEFFEAAYAAGKAVAPKLKARLEDIDENFNRGLIKGNDVPKQMQAAFDSFETEYAKKADEAAQKVWAELLKDHEEYRSYQIKTAVSIGAKIGGIGVGVVSIATAGWTGAGTVMGLIAIVKNTIDLVSKIVDGLKEARELAKEIAETLEALKLAYARESKALNGVEEVAKDVLVRLTGIQLNTVGAATGSVKLFISKIQGCNVNATKMGGEIDNALREADALESKLNKLESQLKGVKGVNLGKLSTKHAQLMVLVGKLVSAAADYKEDNKNGKASIIIWMQQIKDLEGEVPEIAKKVQKWAVPLVDFVYITDVEGAITKTGSLMREYLVLASETEGQLKEANEVGDLAGDVTVLITGLIGK